jgi:hypothetical protein
VEGDASLTLVRVEIRAASFLGASTVPAALCGPSISKRGRPECPKSLILVSNLSGAFAGPLAISSAQIRTEFLRDGMTAVGKVLLKPGWMLNHRCCANEKQKQTDNVCLEHQAMFVAHGINALT